MTQQTTDEIRRRFEVWERHGQTIMLAVVVAVLGFTGKFMWEVNGQLAEIRTSNKHFSEVLTKVEETTKSMPLTYVTRIEFNEVLVRLRELEAAERRSK